MPRTWRVPGNDVPRCPDCQAELSFVCAWTFRDLWGYTDVRTYECPTHGPVFVKPAEPVGRGSRRAVDQGIDNGERDSTILAPRKPAPPLDADAIAIPEPDSD